MRKHKVLVAQMAALVDGNHYDPPKEGFLEVPRPDGTYAKYAVEIHGEHDGVWIVKHTRPSGKWDRQHRATHVSGTQHT